MTSTRSPKPAPRRGRPAGANAQAQRERLLAVAAEVFSQHGPEAAQLKHIAEQAGVDRRLIYHYFKSKDKLYHEVLENIYSHFGRVAHKLAQDADTVESFMAGMMHDVFSYCRENPAFVRLLTWENLRQGQGFDQIAPLGSIAPTLIGRLEPLLAREVERGRCRRDVDAKRLIVTGLALCLYILINKHSLRRVIGFDADSSDALDTWIASAIQQTTDGIRP